jgi:hypothetical protein
VPPGVFSWNDADDNNAFHQKLILMDFDGTLSTELAMYSDKQVYYHEMVTRGLPNGNDGKPVPAQLGVGGGFIPKGAKNVEVAKDFLKYLKGGLGRWLPVVPSMVKSDPFWLDPSDPHRPTRGRCGGRFRRARHSAQPTANGLPDRAHRQAQTTTFFSRSCIRSRPRPCHRLISRCRSAVSCETSAT